MPTFIGNISKNFTKIATFLILILKTILPNNFFANSSNNNLGLNSNKVIGVNNIISGNVDKKVKNLLKAKNIEKFVLYKKPKVKSNKTFKIEFFTSNTRLSFTQFK